MPPKTIFSSEDVIVAALELVKKSGFRDFSARRVAEELKSSTAPVYSCFSSMEELKTEVLARAEAIMLDYSMRPYTGSVFLNMGTGLALFAGEERELFRALLLEGGETADMFEHFIHALEQELDRDELVSQLPVPDRKGVMRRMAIFTYGYATLIHNGMFEKVDRGRIIKTMLETGRDVIDAALRRAGINAHNTE